MDGSIFEIFETNSETLNYLNSWQFVSVPDWKHVVDDCAVVVALQLVQGGLGARRRHSFCA